METVLKLLLAMAHAFGWHPEKSFANYVLRRKERFVRRWRERTPPRIEEGLGVKWVKRWKRWEAVWYADPDLVRPGYPIEKYRLWRGRAKDLNPVEAQQICRFAMALKDESEVWRNGGIQQHSY
jgi:hypothetical protein